MFSHHVVDAEWGLTVQILITRSVAGVAGVAGVADGAGGAGGAEGRKTIIFLAFTCLGLWWVMLDTFPST